MERLLGVLALLFLISFAACGSAVGKAESGALAAITPPIAYNPTDVDDDLAGKFLEHMIAADYRSAAALCSKDFVTTEEASIFQGKHRNLKAFWEKYTDGASISISAPGVMYGHPFAYDAYFYPASIGDKRELLLVGIRDGEVVSFYGDAAFEIIERVLYDLTNENSQDFETINQELGLKLIESPEDMERRWKEVIRETGEYLSSDPPIAIPTFDAAPFEFPSEFKNGRYVIRITQYDLPDRAIDFAVYPEDSAE